MTLDALQKGHDEVLADPQTEALKRSLSTALPYYLNPSNLGLKRSPENRR
jgi:hypothetical protein